MNDLTPSQVWDKRGFMTTRYVRSNPNIEGKSFNRLASIIRSGRQNAIEVDSYPIARDGFENAEIRVDIRHKPTDTTSSGFEYEVVVANGEGDLTSSVFDSLSDARNDRNDKISRIISPLKSVDASPDAVTEYANDVLFVIFKKFGPASVEPNREVINHMMESDVKMVNTLIEGGYSEFEIIPDMMHFTDGYISHSSLDEEIGAVVKDALHDIITNKMLRYSDEV